jgi:hypothetical protein
MVSKIRVRMGEVEVEFEGEEGYLKDGLPELLQSVAALYASSTATTQQAAPSQSAAPSDNTAIDKAETLFQGSINTVAARLSVKQGPDLVIAVLAHSEFVQGKDRTTRAEVLNEMKNATGFFKSSYIGNLSKALSNLVKAGTINELTAGTYALADNTKKSISAKLSTAP